MSDAPRDQREALDKIAERSRRTVLWVQIGEAVLIAMAAVAITVLVITVFNDRHRLNTAQQVIQAQQKRLAAVTAAQVSESHRVANALCDSQFTIATAPLTRQVSKLGVEFVEASRKAFIVLECKGSLGTPPKSLIHLGERLGVPIRY